MYLLRHCSFTPLTSVQCCMCSPAKQRKNAADPRSVFLSCRICVIDTEESRWCKHHSVGSGSSYLTEASRLLGALITLGGVAWQATSTHVELFAAARILRVWSFIYGYPATDMLSGAVGIGLTLSCTASPLLITELAYPTQVSALTDDLVYNLT
jgi:hypothetical protein